MELEEVPTKEVQERGCGLPKPGGLYLVAPGATEPCPKLPVELTVCPTCGEGIKPTRGYTWVAGDALVQPGPHGTPEHAAVCPLSKPLGRCGLLWIGEVFYPTPEAFLAEANVQGVSRRITALPRDFKVGETLVLVAHRKAIEHVCSDCGDEPQPDPDCVICSGAGVVKAPGIFSAFTPHAVEYVIRGDETPDELDALVARGISPVRVELPEPGEDDLSVDDPEES